MGTVVRFPKVRRSRRRRAAADKPGHSAVVVILPVIRIEREGMRVPRRRRRSRVSHS
jgi:hypothetical protein